MGVPGWPLLAFCTASMDSVRIVLMHNFSSCSSGFWDGGVPRVAVFDSRTAAGAAMLGSCDVAGVFSMGRPSGPLLCAGLQFNFVVLAFPSVLVHPQKCELNGRFLFGQLEVNKFDAERRGLGPGIGRMLPIVARPM